MYGNDALANLLQQYTQPQYHVPQQILEDQRQKYYQEYLRTPECVSLLQKMQEGSEKFINAKMGINQPNNNELLEKMEAMQKKIQELESREIPKI